MTAMLEQILNTKLTETEAEGRQRMHGMSKDELIEQILNAKVKFMEMMPRLHYHVTDTARPIPFCTVLLEVNRLWLAIIP